MNKQWSIRKMIFTGMLAALAGVLMSLEFSVPMMPPFYKVDFSDVPSIIAIFLMGPISGCCVELIKIIIKLVTVGTNTMYVGEFANILGILLFVLPIWLVSKKGDMSKKSIIYSLMLSVPIRTAFACFCNACITLPMYANAMGISLDAVIKIVGAVNPAIHSLTGFILLATIPFNVIKLSLNGFAAYLLYDKLLKSYFVGRAVKI